MDLTVIRSPGLCSPCWSLEKTGPWLQSAATPATMRKTFSGLTLKGSLLKVLLHQGIFCTFLLRRVLSRREIKSHSVKICCSLLIKKFPRGFSLKNKTKLFFPFFSATLGTIVILQASCKLPSSHDVGFSFYIAEEKKISLELLDFNCARGMHVYWFNARSSFVH